MDAMQQLNAGLQGTSTDHGLENHVRSHSLEVIN